MFSLRLHGFPPGVPLSSTIKNMYLKGVVPFKKKKYQSARTIYATLHFIGK